MVMRFMLILFTFAFWSAGSLAQDRIALVIGNADYQKPGWILRNPVNDARVISDALDKLNFQTTVLENATQREMANAFADHADRLAQAGKEAIGLVYFSGHGIQANGENLLIPIDATADTQARMRGQAPKLNDLNVQIDLWRDKVLFNAGQDEQRDLYDVIAARP
jgi:uncharacterized caspase-like protein